MATAQVSHPYDPVFQPGAIGQLQLKNRVLMAPMEKNACTADGVPTDRYTDYLVARARNEVALLRVEATFVDPVGKGRPYQLGAHSDDVLPALSRMVTKVQAAGARISFELAHCGRQTNALVTGRQPVSASPVPCQLSGGYLPRELTVSEIDDIVERFVAAAGRVVEAGADAVEIHGASGYLLNAFASPYTNLRSDEYGGSPENRMRFPLRVVAAVRGAVPSQTPVIYRLCAEEFVDGGLTAEDTAPLAMLLEQAGVDLIDVSAGTYESILATQPPMESPPGTLLDLAAKIRSVLQIPVATAGKLNHLAVAAAGIREQKIDFVTIGRGLHADPQLVRKAREGRTREIRRCIACAECVGYLGEGLPAFCAVNPATLREAEFSSRRQGGKRDVVVVGAGPAGLEVARTAAIWGHRVRLFERGAEAGGRTRHGQLVEGRSDFGEPARFLLRELMRLGVTVELNASIAATDIEALAPDTVVVATGAREAPCHIPGGDAAHAISGSDLLEAAAAGRSPVLPAGPGPVAVVGASWAGCHVASLLLAEGREVLIVDLRERLAYDMGEQQGAVLRQAVATHPNTTLHLRTSVEGIDPTHIEVWSAAGDQRTRLAATAVIVVPALVPDTTLVDSIRSTLDRRTVVHAIGDCVAPRKLQDALLEGARLGAAL